MATIRSARGARSSTVLRWGTASRTSPTSTCWRSGSIAGWADRGASAGSSSSSSELFWPTDHANHEFNFWVTRRTAASWLTDALRITRRWPRISTLGWYALYDDPPNEDGDEVHRGLLTHRGRKKPAYWAYKRG